jgi:uncharacterized protein DUF642
MSTSLIAPARGAAALILAASLAAALAGAPASAHRAADAATEVDGPNILQNGGFERGADPGVKLDLSSGSSPLLAGWTVINSATAYGSYWMAEEGTRSVGLLNDGGGKLANASGIKQTFTTTAGQRYRVVFYQGAQSTAPTTVRLTIAGQTHDYTYQADKTPPFINGPKGPTYKIPWVKRTLVATATAASTTIEFDAIYAHGWWIPLDNVQVRAVQSAPAGQTPGTGPGTQPAPLTLTLASASLGAGAQQTVQATAAKGASVALVVDYPDGSQLVVPGHAGPDGHYAYSWALPSSIHGTVKVWLDAGGSIGQATFSVS